jgi:hypothetical protein
VDFDRSPYALENKKYAKLRPDIPAGASYKDRMALLVGWQLVAQNDEDEALRAFEGDEYQARARERYRLMFIDEADIADRMKGYDADDLAEYGKIVVGRDSGYDLV